jgi:hypothetical protein
MKETRLADTVRSEDQRQWSQLDALKLGAKRLEVGDAKFQTAGNGIGLGGILGHCSVAVRFL